VDNSKRYVGAGSGDIVTQLDSGQNSLDGKEGGQDFVTRALNPFGKLYSGRVLTHLCGYIIILGLGNLIEEKSCIKHRLSHGDIGNHRCCVSASLYEIGSPFTHTHTHIYIYIYIMYVLLSAFWTQKIVHLSRPHQ